MFTCEVGLLLEQWSSHWMFLINDSYMSRRRHRFWHVTLRLRSTIRRQHPPQRAVLSHICCFEVVVSQILLDGAQPYDVGTCLGRN